MGYLNIDLENPLKTKERKLAEEIYKKTNNSSFKTLAEPHPWGISYDTLKHIKEDLENEETINFLEQILDQELFTKYKTKILPRLKELNFKGLL